MLNPKRLLVLGDTHGNDLHIMFAIRMAKKNKCDLILQVGDFGYWAHTARGRLFLSLVVSMLAEAGIKMVFLDGNHENFDLLWDPDHEKTEDGFVKVWDSDWLLYSPRGHRFTWSNRKLMTFGGGYSIDKMGRTFGVDWWPQEVITYKQIHDMQAADDSPVDILFTHDYPVNVEFPYKMLNIAESYDNRKMLQHVCDIVKPKKLYHGHMHANYTTIMNGEDYSTRIVGLAHDYRMEESYAICDLEKDDLEWHLNKNS